MMKGFYLNHNKLNNYQKQYIHYKGHYIWYITTPLYSNWEDNLSNQMLYLYQLRILYNYQVIKNKYYINQYYSLHKYPHPYIFHQYNFNIKIQGPYLYFYKFYNYRQLNNQHTLKRILHNYYQSYNNYPYMCHILQKIFFLQHSSSTSQHLYHMFYIYFHIANSSHQDYQGLEKIQLYIINIHLAFCSHLYKKYSYQRFECNQHTYLGRLHNLKTPFKQINLNHVLKNYSHINNHYSSNTLSIKEQNLYNIHKQINQSKYRSYQDINLEKQHLINIHCICKLKTHYLIQHKTL